MFSRFDTILEYDRQTDRHTHRQTHDDSIYHSSIVSHDKSLSLSLRDVGSHLMHQ